MRRKLLWAVFLAIVLAGSVAEAESLVVIVNESNKTEEITQEDLKLIYMGRMTHWSDGEGIIAVNRDARSDVRRTFYKVVLGADPTRKFFLPGTPIPFRTVVQKSANGVVLFVEADKRAIGYLDKSELTGDEKGIRVIKIEGLPGP
jgi:ABC-type phosphate transport system substrate-binding protein